MVNLDFDTNGSGTADAGDEYWDGGKGWQPIGSDFNAWHRYNTVFQGNGKIIDNLYINRNLWDDAGLFGSFNSDAKVEALAVRNANVAGSRYVGILVGSNYGKITGVYTTGRVIGWQNGGGLAGYNQRAIVAIVASYFHRHGQRVRSQQPVRRRAGGLELHQLHHYGQLRRGRGSPAPTPADWWARKGPRYGDQQLLGHANHHQIQQRRRHGPNHQRPAIPPRLRHDGLYAAWDDVDVDGDGTVGVAADTDDDAWTSARPVSTRA